MVKTDIRIMLFNNMLVDLFREQMTTLSMANMRGTDRAGCRARLQDGGLAVIAASREGPEGIAPSDWDEARPRSPVPFRRPGPRTGCPEKPARSRGVAGRAPCVAKLQGRDNEPRRCAGKGHAGT
jgi:hypothetical protein